MGLMDCFKRKVTTGKYVDLLPFESQHFEEIGHRVPVQSGAIEYAFIANLFSGVYQVMMDKTDGGFKPILVPVSYVTPSRRVIESQITFPQDIVRRTKTKSSVYTADQDDWEILDMTHPHLFCNFPIGRKLVPVRIYTTARDGRSILGALEESRIYRRDFRQGFDFRLYDVQLVPTGDTFSFKQWDP